MKRELWAIGKAFASGIQILNSICCSNDDEKEFGWDERWLVAEQINGSCSEMMIDDAYDVLVMIQSIPKNRLCEKIECIYHHPEDPTSNNYCHCQDKCDECVENQKSKLDKLRKKNNFKSK